MKTMTCKQLGGVCNEKFRAETFEEMAEMSRQHGMEMFQKNDVEHLEAMNKMQEIMKKPGEMDKWLESKRKEFETLPES